MHVAAVPRRPTKRLISLPEMSTLPQMVTAALQSVDTFLSSKFNVGNIGRVFSKFKHSVVCSVVDRQGCRPH